MEPGHEDREYWPIQISIGSRNWASMEPGHEDREYGRVQGCSGVPSGASMEPGHEDREYFAPYDKVGAQLMPQWSPVMKTGNTSQASVPGRGS